MKNLQAFISNLENQEINIESLLTQAKSLEDQDKKLLLKALLKHPSQRALDLFKALIEQSVVSVDTLKLDEPAYKEFNPDLTVSKIFGCTEDTDSLKFAHQMLDFACEKGFDKRDLLFFSALANHTTLVSTLLENKSIGNPKILDVITHYNSTRRDCILAIAQHSSIERMWAPDINAKLQSIEALIASDVRIGDFQVSENVLKNSSDQLGTVTLSADTTTRMVLQYQDSNLVHLLRALSIHKKHFVFPSDTDLIISEHFTQNLDTTKPQLSLLVRPLLIKALYKAKNGKIISDDLYAKIFLQNLATLIETAPDSIADIKVLLAAYQSKELQELGAMISKELLSQIKIDSDHVQKFIEACNSLGHTVRKEWIKPNVQPIVISEHIGTTNLSTAKGPLLSDRIRLYGLNLDDIIRLRISEEEIVRNAALENTQSLTSNRSHSPTQNQDTSTLYWAKKQDDYPIPQPLKRRILCVSAFNNVANPDDFLSFLGEMFDNITEISSLSDVEKGMLVEIANGLLMNDNTLQQARGSDELQKLIETLQSNVNIELRASHYLARLGKCKTGEEFKSVMIEIIRIRNEMLQSFGKDQQHEILTAIAKLPKNPQMFESIKGSEELSTLIELIGKDEVDQAVKRAHYFTLLKAWNAKHIVLDINNCSSFARALTAISSLGIEHFSEEEAKELSIAKQKLEQKSSDISIVTYIMHNAQAIASLVGLDGQEKDDLLGYSRALALAGNVQNSTISTEEFIKELNILGNYAFTSGRDGAHTHTSLINALLFNPTDENLKIFQQLATRKDFQQYLNAFSIKHSNNLDMQKDPKNLFKGNVDNAKKMLRIMMDNCSGNDAKRLQLGAIAFALNDTDSFKTLLEKGLIDFQDTFGRGGSDTIIQYCFCDQDNGRTECRDAVMPKLDEIFASLTDAHKKKIFLRIYFDDHQSIQKALKAQSIQKFIEDGKHYEHISIHPCVPHFWKEIKFDDTKFVSLTPESNSNESFFWIAPQLFFQKKVQYNTNSILDFFKKVYFVHANTDDIRAVLGKQFDLKTHGRLYQEINKLPAAGKKQVMEAINVSEELKAFYNECARLFLVHRVTTSPELLDQIPEDKCTPLEKLALLLTSVNFTHSNALLSSLGTDITNLTEESKQKVANMLPFDIHDQEFQSTLLRITGLQTNPFDGIKQTATQEERNKIFKELEAKQNQWCEPSAYLENQHSHGVAKWILDLVRYAKETISAAVDSFAKKVSMTRNSQAQERSP